MPQKLIRLTCDTGDGVFNSLFDEDIRIKEDSEIALQSCSFERKSQVFNITEANNKVQISLHPDEDVQEAYIKTGRYTNTNAEGGGSPEILDEITIAMNKSCSSSISAQQKGVQWKAAVDQASGRVTIGHYISPFFPLGGYNEEANEFLPLSVADYDTPVQVGVNEEAEAVNISWEQSAADGNYVVLSRETATAGTAADGLNECYVFGDTNAKLIKSTGSLRVRLYHLVVNETPTAAFTLAVVGNDKLSKLQDGSITEADLLYGVRVQQPNAAGTLMIQVKVGEAGTFVDTTLAPVNYGVGAQHPDENDMVEISLEEGQLIGRQWTTGGATDPMTPLDINTAEDLTWVIFFHENMDNCQLDACQVDLDLTTATDPFKIIKANPQEAYNVVTDLIDMPIQTNSIGEYEPSVNIANALLGHLGFDSSANPLLTTQSNFKAVNLELVPLGSGGLFTLSVLAEQYWIADIIYDNAYNSDSYLIESQTFMMDSYDTYGLNIKQRNAKSGGSRRNILAVLPVWEYEITNSINGLIQYEPSNRDYISIKNRGDIITRQLRFRILNGAYQSIITKGLASLVVLIKDPD